MQLTSAENGTSMSRQHILVVEDDRSLAEILRYNLEQSGFDVVVCHDGRQGLHQARAKIPSLVVLDLMLPGIDGLEVCRQIRDDAAFRDTKVLMLTARSDETDQVVGFAAGADDYVAKPFYVRVLLERVKALLRRRQDPATSEDVISCQGISIDRGRHRVTVGEQSLELTPSEFGLLHALIRQPGRAFTRQELIDVALGDDAIVLERTIDVHIRGLRKKLGDHAELVETVRGVGYRFRDPVDATVG